MRVFEVLREVTPGRAGMEMGENPGGTLCSASLRCEPAPPFLSFFRAGKLPLDTAPRFLPLQRERRERTQQSIG